MRLSPISAIIFLALFFMNRVYGENLFFRPEQLKADPFTRIQQGQITVSIPYEKESRNETRGGAWVVGQNLLEHLKGRALSFHCEVHWKDLAPKTPGSPAGGKILAVAKIRDEMGRQTEYQVAPLCNGTSSRWRKYSAEFFIRPATESLTILFGIQKSSGTIVFRNIHLASTSGFNREAQFPADVVGLCYARSSAQGRIVWNGKNRKTQIDSAGYRRCRIAESRLQERGDCPNLSSN